MLTGTHTGEGRPLPAIGKGTTSDDADALQFEGDTIARQMKVWHSGMAMRELGWA